MCPRSCLFKSDLIPPPPPSPSPPPLLSQDIVSGHGRWLSATATHLLPGPTRAAAATGPTRTETATQEEQQVHMLLFLSLFLYFHLFFILLFFFSDYFFSGKYNNRRGTKGKRRMDGRGKHVRLLLFFMSFPLSSFILIIVLLFRLSLFCGV